MQGWDRAFSWDASRTVGQFVTTASISQSFGQDRFNNHPLFSAFEHVVYVVTGSNDERVLRLLPVALGAVAVGVLAAAVAGRLGALAGHVAGASVALNPLAVRQFREVRGYALVTLMAIVATGALFALLRDDRRARRTLGYVVAMAVGIGTHLFAAGLLLVHGLVILGRNPRRLRNWGPLAALALGLGLAVQLPALVDGLRQPPQRAFDPTFPIRLMLNLLGGPAAPGMLVLVVVGWGRLRRLSWLPWVVGGVPLLLVAAWLAGPSWLDSRFFIWLVPAVGVAAAFAVAHRPRLAWLAAACLLVQAVAFVASDPRDSEVPNRIAARLAVHAADQGLAVCALGRTRAGLLAYVDVPVLWDFTRLTECDVALEAAGPRPQPLLGAACRRFPYVIPLPAKHVGAAFADRPLPFRVDGEGARFTSEQWQHTATAAVCVDPPFPKGFTPD